MITKKLLLATALAVPAALAFAAPANAQATGGVATLDPTLAVARTKAFTAASTQIRTQFKTNFDQIQAKGSQRQAVLGQLDKNADKRVDDAEFAEAQRTNNPAFKQYEAVEKEISDLTLPVLRSQAFAIEMILQRYREAQTAVVNAKKIGVIVRQDALLYAPEVTDVTAALTTELDRLAPTVPITAPANWRPSQETVAIQQGIQELQQYAMAAAAAQQRQAGATQAAPGTAAPRPAAPAPQQQPPGR